VEFRSGNRGGSGAPEGGNRRCGASALAYRG
jgi:hypothetical protein